MNEDILQAFRKVEHAMANYNKTLEEHVLFLRSTEDADATKLQRMTDGAKAMRDSSAIYLSYARFVAYGMPDSEEMIEDDIQS